MSKNGESTREGAGRAGKGRERGEGKPVQDDRYTSTGPIVARDGKVCPTFGGGA